MMMPWALASSATGAGGRPAVVLPSVNMTMTLALEEDGSNRSMALVKASAWLVLPPALSESTAFFRVSTEVMSWVLAVAVLAKLTTPMWLPEPIWSGKPPVAWAMISMKLLAPSFRFSRGSPSMLPERSKVSTISVGLATISGAAVMASVTRTVPSQSMF